MSAPSYNRGEGPTVENFKIAKKATQLKIPRLCGDLQYIRQHLARTNKTTNLVKCEVCGAKTSFKCTLCDKYVCVFNRKKWEGGGCALSYHDDSFFGLSKSDSLELYGQSKTDWTPPTKNKIKCNARRIETIKETILEEEEAR